MFRMRQLYFCIFLTSTFSPVWADSCFENTNPKGVMPQTICFKEIRVVKWGTDNPKLYLRTSDIDDLFAIQKIEKSTAGFILNSVGDYINYAENCGLTILSQYELKAALSFQGEYLHDKNNRLVIRYKYTPNICTMSSKPGIEHFIPKL